jgi:lipoprotein-anchoring transpeptidase ErfK/SrfK
MIMVAARVVAAPTLAPAPPARPRTFVQADRLALAAPSATPDASDEMQGGVRFATVVLAGTASLGASSTSVAGWPGSAGETNGQPRAQIANSARKGFTYAKLGGQSVAVSQRPGSRPYKRLPAFTEMGSPRHLPVVDVRRDFVAVAPTMKRNGARVWIKRDHPNVTFVRTMYSLRIDLSRRRLQLRKGRRVVLRASVAVGRPGSPTPVGRFAITDKINGRGISSYYGCCVLALNGRQPRLPAGWRGGNRLAIHGTDAPGTIGTAASAGCIRAQDRTLRRLWRHLPLGAPVFIRP